MTVFLSILAYICILLIFSKITTRKAGNDTFFMADRNSSWRMVAFGMVGASISGVTLVSVPGMAGKTDMTYLQTCLGFIAGYFVIAYVLLPVYYKRNLTTIYTYLRNRFGKQTYLTGAWFFILSKITGAAVKFFIVCIILQTFTMDALGIPFPMTVAGLTALIWLYTRRGGIKTLVWTDSFQTLCILTALILIIVNVIQALGLNFSQTCRLIAESPHSRVFVFDDWLSTQNFWKQFISGMFITIVMTGLDQDMMQKNLTCKNLKEAQKDMRAYGFAFLPINLLLLSLGILLMALAHKQGLPLPASGDELLPMFAATGRLGHAVILFFTIGIVAASFSSADSALTALTTSYCVDIRQKPDDVKLRKRAHIGMATAFAAIIIVFKAVNSTSIIDAVYILCSYTYGPLLGLFAYGLLTKRAAADRLVPYIAIASPLLCYAADQTATALWGYKFGYELLLLNGLITFAGVALSGKAQRSKMHKAA